MTNLTDKFIPAFDARTGTDLDVHEDRCPCCGSKGVRHIDNDYSEGYVYMTYVCDKCGSEFSMHYAFEGVHVHNDNHNKED